MNLSGDWEIPRVGNCLPRTCRGVEGVVVEVKIVSWGDVQTKGEVHKRKLTKKNFLKSDLLTSLTSSLTPLFWRWENSRCEIMRWKDRKLITNQIVLYTLLTYVKPYPNILEQSWTNLKLWQIWLTFQSYLRIMLKRSYPYQLYSTSWAFYTTLESLKILNSQRGPTFRLIHIFLHSIFSVVHGV